MNGGMGMHYEMEELIPVVGRLAEKYTAFESTSLPYEKAGQLMEAVLYCIHEAELCGFRENAAFGNGDESVNSLMVSSKKLSAGQAYEAGAACVEKKTRQALKLYHELLPEFHSYGVDCLYDTFVKGLPEFFKWYDVKFRPQDTILTLDYPVLKDISGLEGIDRVYEFINCIRLEQMLLNKFPEDYVIEILEQYTRRTARNMGHGGSYEFTRREIMDNLCEIVFTAVILHILIKKPLSEQIFQESEYARMQEMLSRAELPEIREWLKDAAELVSEQYKEGDCRELPGYLLEAADGLAVRLKNAAGCGTLRQII